MHLNSFSRSLLATSVQPRPFNLFVPLCLPCRALTRGLEMFTALWAVSYRCDINTVATRVYPSWLALHIMNWSWQFNCKLQSLRSYPTPAASVLCS